MSEQTILYRLTNARNDLAWTIADLKIYDDMWDMAESLCSDDIIDQINVKIKKLKAKQDRLTNLVNKLEFQVKGFESRRNPKIKKLQEKITFLKECIHKDSEWQDATEIVLTQTKQEIQNLKASSLELCKVIEDLRFENNNLIEKNNKLAKSSLELAEKLKNIDSVKSLNPRKSWFDWR